MKTLHIRNQIGYLAENNPLYLHMTVIDYLKFIAAIRFRSKTTIDKAINRAVGLCKLESVLLQRINTCSKGFKQRIGIAQAIIHNPSILILDEATSGLDPAQIIEFRELIKHLSSSSTIIISSHILSEIKETCSRVLIVNKGKIIADGAPDSLLPFKQFIISLSISIPLTELDQLLKNIKSIVNIVNTSSDAEFHTYDIFSSADIRDELFSIITNSNTKLNTLTLREENLEDVFMHLTNDKEQ